MDFVYRNYGKLLITFVDEGYNVVSIRDAVTRRQEPLLAVFRHDVEWNVARARAFADMEAARGFRSTFYFRFDTKACDFRAMRRLQDRGFEVGYHFNTLDRCKGDFARAIALFEDDLQRARSAGIHVQTVFAHGNPRVRRVGYESNRDLLRCDPQILDRNDLLVDAFAERAEDVYLRACYPTYQYLIDVGIHWSDGLTTRDILTCIRQRRWPMVYLATHPDYWSGSRARALFLQVAARGLRGLRLNRAIANARQLTADLRRFSTATRSHREHWIV